VTRLLTAVARTFGSVRTSRNFRLYFFGQLISASGTWINATASAWLVLRLTDSGVALGVNTALLFTPILLFGAWGGVLADRFDKRRILLWTQTAFALIALGLWVLVATDVVELWMVYALSLAAGLSMALDNPTRQSFYVEMVGEDNVSNAVSLNSAAFTGSRIFGPAIAGALISTVGIAVCFLIDGISYLAVIAALVAMRPQDMYPQKRTTRLRGHLVSGLRYIWRTDGLRRPLIVMAVVFTVCFNFSVLIPLLAKQTFHGGAGTFGTMSALAGAGSFAGAIAMANSQTRPTMRRLALFSVATGLSLVVVGLAPTLDWAYVAMIPVGYTFMAFLITGNTMLQLTSRPEARGRVMALYGVVFLGSTPIGSPIAGVIGEHLGAGAGFVMSGAVALGLGVVTLWGRFRERGGAEPVPPDIETLTETAA
jgi:MFS family permease